MCTFSVCAVFLLLNMIKSSFVMHCGCEVLYVFLLIWMYVNVLLELRQVTGDVRSPWQVFIPCVICQKIRIRLNMYDVMCTVQHMHILSVLYWCAHADTSHQALFGDRKHQGVLTLLLSLNLFLSPLHALTHTHTPNRYLRAWRHFLCGLRG